MNIDKSAKEKLKVLIFQLPRRMRIKFLLKIHYLKLKVKKGWAVMVWGTFSKN